MDELLFDCFSTWLDLGPDVDLAQEIPRLWQRQKALDGLIDGTVDEADMEDLLADHGINPHEWVEVGEENLIWTLSQCPG